MNVTEQNTRCIIGFSLRRLESTKKLMGSSQKDPEIPFSHHFEIIIEILVINLLDLIMVFLLRVVIKLKHNVTC